MNASTHIISAIGARPSKYPESASGKINHKPRGSGGIIVCH